MYWPLGWQQSQGKMDLHQQLSLLQHASPGERSPHPFLLCALLLSGSEWGKAASTFHGLLTRSREASSKGGFWRKVFVSSVLRNVDGELLCAAGLQDGESF